MSTLVRNPARSPSPEVLLPTSVHPPARLLTVAMWPLSTSALVCAVSGEVDLSTAPQLRERLLAQIHLAGPNLVVDLGIGAIPVLGDLYDVAFRSNRRNLDLFRRHALDPAASTRGEEAFFLGLALLLVGIIVLAAMAIGAVIGALGSVRI